MMENLMVSNRYGILQINSVRKCGDYKIVEGTTIELEDAVYVTGIANSNNIESLQFMEEADIYYLGENHFLVYKNNRYYHYKFNSQDIPKLKNAFEGYKKLGNGYLLISSNQKKSIYNINQGITPFYTMLSKFHFSPKYNKKIASFFDTIYTENDEMIEICGMIDIDNKFTNNSIYNITSDEFISIHSVDEYMEYCNSLHTKEKKEVKRLSKIKKYIDYIRQNFQN